jgi:gas vesicle protein
MLRKASAQDLSKERNCTSNFSHLCHSKSQFSGLLSPWTSTAPSTTTTNRRASVPAVVSKSGHVARAPTPAEQEPPTNAQKDEHASDQPSKMDEETPAPRKEEQYQRQVRRLARLTDEVLLKRTQLDLEQQTLEQMHDFFAESTDALIAAVDGGLSRKRSKGQLALKSFRDQYRKDRDDLRGQQAVVKGLKTELTNLEFRLWEKEKTLGKILLAVGSGKSPQLESGVSDLSEDSDSSQAETVKTELSPLQEEYFDKKGDAGICLERLQELDVDHQEGLTQREFIKDRGDTLEVPDEEFEATYLASRKELVRDLDATQAVVEELEQRCIAAGLSIEPCRRPSTSSPSGLEGEEGFLEIGTPVDDPLGNSQASIEQWLDSTEFGMGANMETTPPSGHGTPRIPPIDIGEAGLVQVRSSPPRGIPIEMLELGGQRPDSPPLSDHEIRTRRHSAPPDLKITPGVAQDLSRRAPIIFGGDLV